MGMVSPSGPCSHFDDPPRLPGRLPGRGAALNPPNRFERMHVEYDPAEIAALPEEERPALRTEFYDDQTSSVLVRNDSPDIGFEVSLNPYRGCEHGCPYCYARPYHEFLGFSSGVDFESRIMVKRRAADLLRAELSKPGWRPTPIALSSATDPYQPVERRLGITRECLAVLAELRQPVSVITKNRLVARDVDLLGELAANRATSVTFSIVTLDPALARELEPRASPPALRLEAMRVLRAAGVPVGVNIAPVIPGLNEHEIPAILEAAAASGASYSGWAMLRLPYAVKDVFLDWLDRHYPGKKSRVLSRIREVRGGKLNDSAFGLRMSGAGIFAEQIGLLFAASARRFGLSTPRPELRADAFRHDGPEQLVFAGL
jgi:DNA repair photolyase